MPTYTVEFAASDGRISTLQVEAPNERGAIAVVETSGGTPIEVRAAAVKSPPAKARFAWRGRRMRGARRAVVSFTHELTAIVESGIPVVAGLRAIAEQTHHRGLQRSLQDVAARIEDGAALAEALQPETGYFNPVYIRTVAAGEAAGQLAEALGTLGRYEEQELENITQVRHALIYPAMVVFALVAAVTFMLLFVVPQFADMFAKFDAELPLATQLLVGGSVLLRDHIWIPIAAIVAGVLVWRRLFACKGPRQWLDRWKLRVPIFGPLMLSAHMRRLADLLYLMTRSSLPIVQGLRLTADSMANAELSTDIHRMAGDVEGGCTLGEAFSRSKWAPPLVKRMLSIGEQAGNTDHILEYLSRYYTSRTQRNIKAMATAVEPLLVTGLAGVVLLFSLAIFSPMWKMLKLIGSA